MANNHQFSGVQMTIQVTGSKSAKAVWQKTTVLTFCDVCIRAIEQNFRPHTHFNKQGWEFIVKEFQARTGLQYAVKQHKNKWEALKKEYKLWKDLMRNETGLGWDTHKNIVAADDAWWEGKMKVNPSFANFRVGGIEPQLEDKLEVMFFTIVATGEFAIAPGCDVRVTPQEESAGVEGSGDSEEGIPFTQESLDGVFEGGGSRRRNVEERGSARSSFPLKKAKRQLGGAAMIAKHLDTLVTAVASRSSTVNSKVTEPELPCLGDIVDDLQSLPGLDKCGSLFMFATELLEDKRKREVYLRLDVEQKLAYLNYHFTYKGPK